MSRPRTRWEFKNVLQLLIHLRSHKGTGRLRAPLFIGSWFGAGAGSGPSSAKSIFCSGPPPRPSPVTLRALALASSRVE